MKLIMENWREFLAESKSITWKDLSSKISLDNIEEDIEVFYIVNDLIQRYSSEIHSLLAKRRREDEISKSKKGFSMSPKDQSFSPELRWSYTERPRVDNETAGSYSTESPSNMPNSEREQGAVTIQRLDKCRIAHGLYDSDQQNVQSITDNIINLAGFIKRPTGISQDTLNIYDRAAAKGYLNFITFFKALSSYGTLQHEIGHHIQFNMGESSDYEVYKKYFGEKAEDVMESNCWSPEVAVTLQDIKLLQAAIPKMISDLKKDNLPGNLKWETWVDSHTESRSAFIELATSMINLIMSSHINSMKQYHSSQLSKVKDCLSQEK